MYKMFVKMLVNIAVCISTAAAFAQTLTTTKLADTAVNLVIPKGHCHQDSFGLGALYKFKRDNSPGNASDYFQDLAVWCRFVPFFTSDNHSIRL